MVLRAQGSGTLFAYAGEQRNKTGFNSLRVRFYDAATARFLTCDPVWGAVGGSSIRFNPYTYAGSNPINDAVGEPRLSRELPETSRSGC